MPKYDYFCEENKQTIEVSHPIDVVLTTWGELCYVSQTSIGDTAFDVPVRKRIRTPYLSIPISNSKLKEHGFTKLVKRDQGVYENVTALNEEARYMKAGDNSTTPHFHKKISD